MTDTFVPSEAQPTALESGGSASPSLPDLDDMVEVSASNLSAEVDAAASPILEPELVQAASQAIDVLRHRLLQNLPSHRNLFFSPPHLYWLLCALLQGSKGSTNQQLDSLLSRSDFSMPQEQLQFFFKSFIRLIQQQGKRHNVNFVSAFYVSNMDALFEPFLKMVSDYYFVSIRPLLLNGKPERTKSEINRWVEMTTRGLIPSILGDYVPQSPPCSLIVSAVYVEHVWGAHLNYHKTILANFYNNGSEPSKTKMLRSLSNYKYCVSKTLAARCLIIPSAAKDWEMALFLPTDRKGVHVVEYRLDPDILRATLASCQNTQVELSMPNIEMESSMSLRDVLEELGLTDLFDERKAQMMGMFKDPGTALTEVVHKMKVKVAQTGEEGEHEGDVMLLPSGQSTRMVVEFHVNHPFLFVIYDAKYKTMLFVGRVVEMLWS